MFEEEGIVLIMEPVDERDLRKFILTIPQSVYKKKEISLQYGVAIGEGYTNIIEEIIGVHIESELVTVIGYVGK
ncbi:hypothetical protein CN680_00220 [Bacillus pseudomycoides]|uniref:hypothetical protein n=1 Tax=Bacillus pseudomycoides TaxID=64104 RepID=UPI000BED5751|nr:hypothetical protein [Bacillus pseudomycoides]PED72470.1 hypothetical protein CON97_08670 [Bacillus pseudomycoides]PEI41875.1 hypothetical protein CN620_11400 [Bacillus pseudomycoides]PEJ81971.1 hypothetical protein CN680_00220 [Bacillus pseudomycoides]PEM12476.1 hypothetical protein CN628_20050 [Bacillus pseudomycoides]PEO98413.1 hypothetical protein CN550_14545 [Bacillus pseudomycoides]